MPIVSSITLDPVAETNPPFNDLFSFQYDKYSLNIQDLPIPKGCHVYTPDNHDDYHCLMLWQPAPELGAPKWIRGGKRILIGVYRDEGRSSTPIQMTNQIIQWSRVSTTLTIFCPKKHYLNIGDSVNLSNINTPALVTTVIALPTSTQFQVSVANIGLNSGIEAGWAKTLPVDITNQYVVFRLLPSFSPVSIATILEILADATPNIVTKRTTLTNIKTGINENRTIATIVAGNSRINRQQIDERKKPLVQNYDAAGQVILPPHRFAKTDNESVYITSPYITQYNTVANSDPRVFVYDYYGFDLNDKMRGPFYSSNIIAYGSTSNNGIIRLLNNNSVIYSENLHDRFGDFVTGITSTNLLKTRKPVQPIRTDQHNFPYKSPL